DVAPAAYGVVSNVVEVDERVVFLDVWIAVADEAVRWHRLLVRPPRLARGLEVVSDVACRNPAGRAVRSDPVRAATGEGQIVGKARMRNAVVVRGEGPRSQQAVRVRSGRAADDLVVSVVLHHDHEDVIQRGYGRGLH